METLSTINITGPDAFEFLQGQLTNDLRGLETASDLLSAWCNPKGRVIWFGTVRKVDGGYALSAPAAMADTLVGRLTMFRFRAKVDIARVDADETVDPAELVGNGHPYIGPEQSEQFTPHMLNLDLLGAISLDKGCYTGQEVVARTHYRGATKRRTLRFASAAPVSVGDKVQLDGRDVGEVLNVADPELLAVVPLEAATAGLTVNGTALEVRPLPYLEVPS